jgi:hypothetical protein
VGGPSAALFTSLGRPDSYMTTKPPAGGKPTEGFVQVVGETPASRRGLTAKI